MKPTVLLFDVDGTLITTGGVGRRAIEKTFEKLFSRADACTLFRFDGMTDRAIVRQGLAAIGEACTDKAIDAVLAVYLDVLAAEVTAADLARYRVHPGMERAIDGAHELGMAVGLGTGNVKDGARLKLERVNLFARFNFGGFGCDHEQRVELIRCGAQRGADALGAPLSACRVVVIGDTPKDVAAAQGIGAESVGVGTGSFSPQQLKESGATHAFEHLDAPGAIEAVLGV
jgi:phosphoglycolate phosphatase-like HAD superfamily hydrolase